METVVHLHADDQLLVAVGQIIHHTRYQHGVVTVGITTDLWSFLLGHLIIMEHAIIITRHILILTVHQPFPTAALCEEQFILIFKIPFTILLGIIIAQQSITLQESLTLCHILRGLPQEDSLIEDPFVVVRNP